MPDPVTTAPAAANVRQVQLGPELFHFDSFQQWVDKAQGWFKSAGQRSCDHICLDAAGRVCMIGRDFMRARDEGTFPVTVYLIDPKAAPVFQTSPAPRRSREMADRLIDAANAASTPRGVQDLINAARDAAGMLRDKAEAVDSYDLGYVIGTLQRMAGDEYGGQERLAHELGITRGHLGHLLKGNKVPGAKVLQALGLERVTTYRNEVSN